MSNVSCAKGFKLNRNYTSELLASSNAVLGQVSTASFQLGLASLPVSPWFMQIRPITTALHST